MSLIIYICVIAITRSNILDNINERQLKQYYESISFIELIFNEYYNQYFKCMIMRLNEWRKRIQYFGLWMNWLISKDFQIFYQQRKCVSLFCTCYLRQSGWIFAYNIFANFYVLCCCTLLKTLKGHPLSRKNDEIIDDYQTITIW